MAGKGRKDAKFMSPSVAGRVVSPVYPISPNATRAERRMPKNRRPVGSGGR